MSSMQSSNDSRKQSSRGLKTQLQKSGHNSQGTKSRRVRTGCLTCRERHLKCDEALPRCQNCSKSGRVCKRGIRLNFIDTQTAAPPHSITPPPRAQISFQDESREIASEYVGGAERYPPLQQHITLVANEASSQFDFTNTLNASLLPPFPGATHAGIPESILGDPQYTSTHSLHGQNLFLPKISMTPTNDQPCITNPEEVLLLQVFIEEVALWMDSMDADKHVSLIIQIVSYR
jgi:Fungal Zn(2)-Cys(6) binuclear cluster domain